MNQHHPIAIDLNLASHRQYLLPVFTDIPKWGECVVSHDDALAPVIRQGDRCIVNPSIKVLKAGHYFATELHGKTQIWMAEEAREVGGCMPDPASSYGLITISEPDRILWNWGRDDFEILGRVEGVLVRDCLGTEAVDPILAHCAEHLALCGRSLEIDKLTAKLERELSTEPPPPSENPDDDPQPDVPGRGWAIKSKLNALDRWQGAIVARRVALQRLISDTPTDSVEGILAKLELIWLFRCEDDRVSETDPGPIEFMDETLVHTAMCALRKFLGRENVAPFILRE